ncbi:MAG TPA: chemotaxis protein CheB [Bryobacteraceae bacterium]|nr:chemotaxis protein CheB [Bryobacteraceae bacterium]
MPEHVPVDQLSRFRDGAVVAVAGSAGSIVALRQILASLPSDFPAPILYTHHMSGERHSILAEILQWETFLGVRWAEPGDVPQPGFVYICPPSHTMFARPGGSFSQKAVHRSDALHRADVLFTSVAMHHGPRAVAVVLSGGGQDGREGVYAIRDRGGTVIAQDDSASLHDAMPRAAIATGCADLILPVAQIAPSLLNLVRDSLSVDALRILTARLRPAPPRHYPGFDRLLLWATKAMATDLGNIQLLHKDNGCLNIVAQRGFGLDFLDYFHSVTSADSSACARALNTRFPVSVPDVLLDSPFAPHRNMAASAGFRAVHSIPLIDSHGAPRGILSTHFRDPRQLQPREFGDLGVLARLCLKHLTQDLSPAGR